jgi:hypothetical protein
MRRSTPKEFLTAATEASRVPEEFTVSWEVTRRVLLIHFLKETAGLIQPISRGA